MSFSGVEHSALSTQHSALGLLGGTFNPIHNGHLVIARQAREALDLDQVLFVPTGDPPHKSGRSLAPATDRLEMVRLAIGSDRHLALCDLEMKRPGKSYSIDTVRELLQQYGRQTEFWFLIGIDAFLELPTWREPEELLRLCAFAVISRPGCSFQTLSRLPLLPPLPMQALVDLDHGIRTKLDVASEGRRLTCLRLAPCDISASNIRTKIAQGVSVANLLPPPVESYIIQHHLYR